MKNILTVKLYLLLTAVITVQLSVAQDVPPPATAPAYEAPAKTKKKKRGTVPVAPPAVIENSDTPATPPKTESEAKVVTEDTLSDYEFSHTLDLLTLYTFLGDYIDSNRNKIKTEGESVFYQTEKRFKTTVENYIEVKHGKGELKYVFYSGNDYTIAMNKYRELEEICRRIKEIDLTVTESKYCEGCYGLRFSAVQGVRYWLQVINKPAGGWDVMIIHSMSLDKYYLKEVAKPVTVATTTKPAATEPPASTDVNKLLKDMQDQKEAHRKKVAEAFAKSLPNTIQEDFCSIVQRIIKQFPNDFAGWKLEERPQRMKLFAGEFYSKYMIQGSVDAVVHEDKMAAFMYEEKRRVKAMQYSWTSTLFNGKSEFSKILALYQSYTAQIDECAISCCTFVKKKERLDIAEGQLTRWTVSSLQPGASDKYRDMIIELRFSYDAYDGIWDVDFWIRQE